MKCLFPIYPESWICPQPLVPVCVIAIHHLSYENARGINPNLNQRLSSNCLLFVRKENANAPANKGILFSAGLCLHLKYSFFTHSCYTNNLTVPCMSVLVKREAWRAIREPIQHVRAANETCIWTGFRVWWWWMHCAPSLQLNKEPLAQRQASADIPLKPWPYSCMHWISLWHPRLSPSPHHRLSPTPSVALPCRLHSLCNHVLSPSDEKLISIHSYQREASSHCWHRWDCCVCSLCFWGHALERRRESLMFLVLWGKEQDYSDEWVGWCFFFNFMQFCLSDSTDQGKHQLHLLLKTLSTSTIYDVWKGFMVSQDIMYLFGIVI